MSTFQHQWARWSFPVPTMRSVTRSPFNAFNGAPALVLADECTNRKPPKYRVKGRHTIQYIEETTFSIGVLGHTAIDCPDHPQRLGSLPRVEGFTSLDSQDALHVGDTISRVFSRAYISSDRSRNGIQRCVQDQRAVSDRKHNSDSTDKSSRPSVSQGIVRPIWCSCL